uniref:Uncharacterized protein n=1 Tax=Trichogramma kaykai TaxID=54128 RepID=A0ABD2WQ55_9HYME
MGSSNSKVTKPDTLIGIVQEMQEIQEQQSRQIGQLRAALQQAETERGAKTQEISQPLTPLQLPPPSPQLQLTQPPQVVQLPQPAQVVHLPQTAQTAHYGLSLEEFRPAQTLPYFEPQGLNNEATPGQTPPGTSPVQVFVVPSSPYFYDITGFVDNNNAVVAKELALMPITYNGVPTTWFFKPLYEWNQLNEEAKSYNEYLIYRDGLKWESGEIDYDCVKKVLDKQLKDAKIIFIKDFKVGEWLVSNGFHNFYDVSHIRNYDDIRIFDMLPYSKHTHPTIMSCATKNVKKLLFDVMMIHC